MDILVPITMKNAAKCDTQCELQNSLNHQIFERNPRQVLLLYSWHVCFSIQNFSNLNMIDKFTLQTRLSSNQKGLLFLPNEAVTFFVIVIGKDILRPQNLNILPFVSEIKQDNPLNLSISLSGGKENNNDCLSSGERTGISPSFNRCLQRIVT